MASDRTVRTSAGGYCTPATFLLLYDAALVGALVRNNGTTATPTELLSDDRLAHALLSAAGLVESACLVGRNYDAEDLEALTGAGKALLERLVADLAMGLIRGRPGQTEAPTEHYRAACEVLNQLRRGERIFPFLENADAGLPDVDLLTETDIEAQRRTSRIAGRYFGNRRHSGDY